MMVPTCHVVCLAVVLGLSSSATEQSVHINFRYPLKIGTTDGKFEGRICSSMKSDALIPVEPEKMAHGGACEMNLDKYLKIEIRNVSWPPAVQHYGPSALKEATATTPGTMNTTAGTTGTTTGTTNTTQGATITTQGTSNTTAKPPTKEATTPPSNPVFSEIIKLPAGVLFDVSTNLIDVSDEYHLIVRKPQEFGVEKEVQFYVVLVASDSQQVVSNPIPFIVRIDRPPDEGRPHGAAMFAGVLLLAIILIALLIPITVCVKRRRKAGKPICTCTIGSPDVEKDESTGQVNNGYIREPPRDTKSISSNSSEDPKQTIGSHQLRTVSDFHFKPTWLDPHFQEMDVIHEGTSNPDLTNAEEDCRL